MFMRTPLLLPKDTKHSLSPNKEIHPLTEKESLQLLAWTVSGKKYLQKEFQKNLTLLSQMEGKQVLNTNRPGLSGVVSAFTHK